ncbi:hypothetical protein [Candidatus Spongiihabitans sp.]|uniref:hypothetical protein n=1 Tax=Candidatus Spongiihabitans sp. TaxID=3101308 RepID=UPI003C6F5C1C
MLPSVFCAGCRHIKILALDGACANAISMTICFTSGSATQAGTELTGILMQQHHLTSNDIESVII